MLCVSTTCGGAVSKADDGAPRNLTLLLLRLLPVDGGAALPAFFFFCLSARALCAFWRFERAVMRKKGREKKGGGRAKEAAGVIKVCFSFTLVLRLLSFQSPDCRLGA